MEKWISVKDKLPQPAVGVLVTDGVYVWTAECYPDLGTPPYWGCHGWSGYEMEPDFGVPTHWMPLPEPPKPLTPRGGS